MVASTSARVAPAPLETAFTLLATGAPAVTLPSIVASTAAAVFVFEEGDLGVLEEDLGVLEELALSW